MAVHKILKLELNVDNDALRDEWKLLQLENLPPYDPSMRVDHFWRKIFAIKNAFGDAKYPYVAKVVKASQPIAHGSADIERGFSVSKIQLPDNRASTEERLHNARLNIKDALNEYDGCPEKVPITKDLLKAGRAAYHNYNEHLAEQRRAKVEEMQRKEEEENQRLDREAEEANQMRRRETLAKLAEELEEKEKEASEERMAADALLTEATSKLADALKRNDIAGQRLHKECSKAPKV